MSPNSPENSAAPAAQADVRAPSQQAQGVLHGLAAYTLWGLMPLYFSTLQPAQGIEVVAARIVFSVLFCAVLMAAMRGWKDLRSVLAHRPSMLRLGAASALIACNWLIYVFAVLSHHALEASLGYFINPIIPILIGVIVYREKLRPLQWAGVGLGVVAVGVMTAAYGRLPWISLGLALTFGLYGFAKKSLRPGTTAISSLTVETVFLAPVALVVLAMQIAGIGTAALGHSTLFGFGAGHFWLMALSGVATALPLLFFAASASRLPLSTLGLLQYVGPVLQFIVALVFLGEHMDGPRWGGFAFIWLALILLTADMLIAAGRAGRLARRGERISRGRRRRPRLNRSGEPVAQAPGERS